MWVVYAYACAIQYVEVRGQLWSGFFLPPFYGFLGLNCQACVAGTFTAEPCHHPLKIICTML